MSSVPDIPEFVFVTANRGKIAEARLALGRDVETAEIDLPEIQSLDLAEVLERKAQAAWDVLQRHRGEWERG